MITKPLIHYVFRHSIGMVQMQEGEDLGAIERVFVEADPRFARKAALNFYAMYCEVLQQTEEFNKKMELEEYVRSLHGHPTLAALSSRAWNTECSDSEIGCMDIEVDSTRTDPMVVMVVDGTLTDTGNEEELLIKGGSYLNDEGGDGGMTKIEHEFYAKAGINL